MDASRDGLGPRPRRQHRPGHHHRDPGRPTRSTATATASARGHYLEDAGYPAFAAWLAESGKGLGTLARAFQFGYRRAVEDMTRRRRLDRRRRPGRADRARASLTATSLPLLGMGRDIPDGVMRLGEGRLEVDWTIETSIDYFEGVRDDDAHDRRPARRHLLRQPALVGQAGDHRAPARRRPHGPARRARGCATSTARCSATPACT